MVNNVYSFGRMFVKDFYDYTKRDGLPFLEVLAQYNGKLLAATENGVTVEGEEDGNWTVLIEFKTGKDAFDFYASEEYAPLKKLRLEELTDGALAVSFPAELPF